LKIKTKWYLHVQDVWRLALKELYCRSLLPPIIFITILTFIFRV